MKKDCPKRQMKMLMMARLVANAVEGSGRCRVKKQMIGNTCIASTQGVVTKKVNQ